MTFSKFINCIAITIIYFWNIFFTPIKPLVSIYSSFPFPCPDLGNH